MGKPGSRRRRGASCSRQMSRRASHRACLPVPPAAVALPTAALTTRSSPTPPPLLVATTPKSRRRKRGVVGRWRATDAPWSPSPPNSRMHLCIVLEFCQLRSLEGHALGCCPWNLHYLTSAGGERRRFALVLLEVAAVAIFSIPVAVDCSRSDLLYFVLWLPCKVRLPLTARQVLLVNGLPLLPSPVVCRRCMFSQFSAD